MAVRATPAAPLRATVGGPGRVRGGRLTGAAAGLRPADPRALTQAEADRLPALAEAVLADPRPALRLRRELGELAEAQLPALAAALFESLQYRADVRDYWVYHGMWRVYEALGPAREGAAYLAAAQAVQLVPVLSGSSHAFRDLIRILQARGRAADALDAFRHQLHHSPEYPAMEPYALRPLLAAVGETLPDQCRPDVAPAARRDHRVFRAEVRAPWRCVGFDGVVPSGLRRLAATDLWRPPVDVAELRDAEVLISHNAVVVIDRNGVLHGDVSVCGYPDAVRQKLEREAARDVPISLREVDEAMVMADYCPPPNLCHFLFDQLTRLAIYRRLGGDPTRAAVVAAEPRGNFRELVLRRAGVTDVVSTARLARLRARRLLVSSNCRDVRHFGHFGAGWAIDFVRETLGGRGERGWRRLYVSRADAGRRRVVNEAEIAALLEPHGFEVIVPGTMPYEAQVAAFRQASHVIAPHGAALAHMVLCPPEAKILELFHPLFTEDAFAMQVQAAGIHYVAMLVRDGESDAPEWNDPRVAGKEMR